MFSVDCSHCGRCEYLAKTLASGWLHNDVAHHVKLLVRWLCPAVCSASVGGGGFSPEFLSQAGGFSPGCCGCMAPARMFRHQGSTTEALPNSR